MLEPRIYHEAIPGGQIHQIRQYKVKELSDGKAMIMTRKSYLSDWYNFINFPFASADVAQNILDRIAVLNKWFYVTEGARGSTAFVATRHVDPSFLKIVVGWAS